MAFNSPIVMKRFLNAKLRNEFVGQAILDMVFQQMPITERNLVKQLRIRQLSIEGDVQRKVLAELIAEMSARLNSVGLSAEEAKKSAPADSRTSQGITVRNKNILH